MKLTIPLGCLGVIILTAAPVFAGSHQNRSMARPARSAPATMHSAPSFARSRPAVARNWNSQIGTQRFNRQSSIARSQFVNRQRFVSNQQFGNRQGSVTTNSSRQITNRRSRDGQFRSARFSGQRNWSDWRRRHHRHCNNNRFVFIGSFGYPFYGFGYPYYYDYYPSLYYSSYYPYSSDYVSSDYDASDSGYYSNSDGTRGSIVIEVQRRLSRDGFYQGAIDGEIGSRTHYAIRAYERSHGLAVDGEIDDQLLATMGLR